MLIRSRQRQFADARGAARPGAGLPVVHGSLVGEERRQGQQKNWARADRNGSYMARNSPKVAMLVGPSHNGNPALRNSC